MKEKIKHLLGMENEEKDTKDKKKIENLVVLVIVIIITVVAINYIWNGDKKEKTVVEDESKKLAVENTTKEASADDLETRLERILSNINGVGNVKVLITYSQTSQVVPMYDEDSTRTTTEETDSSGGTRVTNEVSSKKDIIYEENDNKKSPITQSILSAKIEGAVVTAEGAKNAEVKTSIIQAVEAVTGLSTYKIQVFEMKKN